MADSSAEITANIAPVEQKKVKKSVSAGTKKSVPRPKANHPPTSEMVKNAIQNLKERGGSSLSAIKKYLVANYKIDAEKLSPFIKKYLKSAVANGSLIQTKGKGASGSFKLAGKAKVEKKTVEKKTKPIKKSGDKKEKKESAKITKKKSSPKKVTEKKKSATAAAKAAKKSGAVKTKSPKQKATKPSKTGGVKAAKVPKPKKLNAAGKKTTEKKTSAKK